MEYPTVGFPGILWDQGFLGGHPGGLVIVKLFQEDPTSLPAKDLPRIDHRKPKQMSVLL